MQSILDKDGQEGGAAHIPRERAAMGADLESHTQAQQCFQSPGEDAQVGEGSWGGNLLTPSHTTVIRKNETNEVNVQLPKLEKTESS